MANGGERHGRPDHRGVARPHLPFEFIGLVRRSPDGSFPHGIPNPLLPENRAMTADAVRWAGADLGVAWDGDFDRCFFFDETGDFVDGQYVVALLARAALGLEPGATIVLDPRVTWATTEAVTTAGGNSVLSKTGHAFVKAKMRETGAVYGGEMSAHHYFRDFFHCDSGMVPWLLVAQLLSVSRQAAVGTGRRADASAIPSAARSTWSIPDSTAALARSARLLRGPSGSVEDCTDGVSLEFPRLAGQRARVEHRAGAAGEPRDTRQTPTCSRSKTDEVLTVLREA